MVAKLFYTLWRISLVASFLLFPFLTAQRIDSTSSNSVPYLYSFVIHNDYVYLGGEQVVEIVNIADLTSARTVNVSRFSQNPFCALVSQPYCNFNIIDHIFPFATHLLACGSNGGVGGCSLFQGSPDTTFTPINNFTIQLSGNVRDSSSLLSASLFYLQNSIFFNPENNVIYTQYYHFGQKSFTLGLHNFSDFRPFSAPTVSSAIPEITSTFDLPREAQTRDYFFNSPTLGRIFRYASTSTIDFDFIHIPFTEIVLERSVSGLDYEYLTPSFHGRLARICADDLGQFTGNLIPFIGTFNKITIDCRQALGVRYSIDSSYVSIALKEIFILDSENIFGFFTSQNTAEQLIQSSAVCKFISDRTTSGQDFNIETGFNSVYYEGYQPSPVSGNTSWTCAYPTTRVAGDLFAATTVNILHMEVVFNEASLAFNKHFEAIIMDVTPVTTSAGSRNITLFYATTFDGYLIKMKVDNTISVISQFKVTENTKIINPQIQQINNIKYLFAISNSRSMRVSLQLCHSYVTAISCYIDPECVWENSTVSCIQYDLISLRDVPPDSSLTVDDTCQLMLLPSTLYSIHLSLQCQVKLPDIDPNIIISTVTGAPVNTPVINFARSSTTSANIDITNLESLTGYRITVKLNYVFAAVPDLVLFAYTQFDQIIGSSPSPSPLTPICPSANTFSSISVTTPVDLYAALTVCAVCNSRKFCIAMEMYNPTVPYTFPWSDCVLSTSLYSPEGLVVNSSTCTLGGFNRCSSLSPGTFQHLNFTFITSPTSITIILEDGISPLEYGIEQYTFTIDGTDYIYNSSQIDINGLKPNTPVPIVYTATTQCGSTFNVSETINTDADWPQVDNCQLTNDSSQLVFQFRILNPGLLCPNNLSDCVEVQSTCSLNYESESSGTLTYTGSATEGINCTVNVFPSGKPNLLAYYGCTVSLSVPITFSIDSIIIEDVSANSVAFTYSNFPSGMNSELSISLRNSSGIVQDFFIADFRTGSNLPGAFDNLDPGTDYTITIVIQNDLQTIPFKTQLSIQFNLSCSPIDSYNAMQVGNGAFNVEVFRNTRCSEGLLADSICYGSPSNISMASFTLYSYTTQDISLGTDFAFGLFTNITTCPPLNDANYRFIYSDSIDESSVTPSTPEPSTTAPPTTTPVIPAPQPLTVILASVILFYLAVGTSSLTVLTSAGGLILLFGLIIYYPKLLKKKEMKSAARIEREGQELSGMNNPISDSS